MPSPSRPIGPTPIVSTATSRAPTRTPTPSRRCAGFSASPPGCGATPTCSTSSAGFAPATTSGNVPDRLLRARPLQPLSLDRGRDRVSRPDRSRGRGGGRASATRASSGSERASDTATQWRPACRRRATARCSGSWSTCSGPATRICAGTGSPPRTSSSTPSRTPGSWSAPSATTARCSRRRPRPGTSATSTWPRPSSG